MNIQRKKWEIFKMTDKGKYRELNEDCIGHYSNESFDLLVVADGMGGHNAGEVASEVAVKTLVDFFNNAKISNAKEQLINAVKTANEKINSLANLNNEYNGMGTTITACLINKNDIYVINVGDSRCYIVKNGSISRITKDHSLVQELVDIGSITEEEARNHPSKNIITRALGTNLDVEVDFYHLENNKISHILLCTDGLSNVVTNEEILKVIKKITLDKVCKKLVMMSIEKGSRDNISVICGGEC
ncbi:Stp1/IreP family PP2C-type Ser/Thr phosphatase [Clostridium sediminicola]|uniref:Stp1/IreP family PP2C-type Ser/Thr phosphatase n=1 Tax=Clostridium sediminicola TaxID=3114879 RepID=UPI0031F1F211